MQCPIESHWMWGSQQHWQHSKLSEHMATKVTSNFNGFLIATAHTASHNFNTTFFLNSQHGFHAMCMSSPCAIPTTIVWNTLALRFETTRCKQFLYIYFTVLTDIWINYRKQTWCFLITIPQNVSIKWLTHVNTVYRLIWKLLLLVVRWQLL